MYSQYLNKVAWCNVCNQGWIEIVKGANASELFVMCNECESEWIKPEDVANGKIPRAEMEESVLKATFCEIKNKGWARYIIND